jgi:hypothetical protein
MKRLIFALCLAFSTAASALPPELGSLGKWVDGAIATNPAANQVLVDSGVLDPVAYGGSACPSPGSSWTVDIDISTTVGGFFKIITLDGAAAVVSTKYVGAIANSSTPFHPQVTIPVPVGGKIQVQSNSALTGSVQVSIGTAFTSCSPF